MTDWMIVVLNFCILAAVGSLLPIGIYIREKEIERDK